MRVILLEDVPELGKKNEIKEVRGGYARNFLFPRRLAAAATETALGSLKNRRETEMRKETEERKKYEQLAAKLKNLTLNFRIKLGERGRAFGSVTALKIKQALAQKGIEAEKNWILLEEPIKTSGEKTVKIKFPLGIEGEIKVAAEKEEKKN